MSRFRPPATPLVTHDPYFSIWSPADRLTDDSTRHWTGARHALCGLIRIDDRPYRFLGPEPRMVPALAQRKLTVLPTRTIYQFEGEGIRLEVMFLSPLLPEDLDVLARPVTYLIWRARAMDGRTHRVALYLDCSAEIAVNTPDQPVTWGNGKAESLDWLWVGSEEQLILRTKGDDRRIDWGRFYLALPEQPGASRAIARASDARRAFVESGNLPPSDDLSAPRAASDGWPVLACSLDLGEVGAKPVSRHLLLAYDDIKSIEYLGRQLSPYWRREGEGPEQMLGKAAREFRPLQKRSARFDRDLLKKLESCGGKAYARLAALAYRQCFAAHKLVAHEDGSPLLFSKENFSNGCIATVDVTYPSIPFFLALNPELVKAILRPVLEYAGSERWRFPFAPHDLGTYPLANGQVYGGGEATEENQMPVEESGNMLIMLAALAQATGTAEFASQYWPMVQQWAGYLREHGLDPASQLCTDDFAGHLAHNANLSLKAILALGGYSRLCETLGKRDEAVGFRRAAEDMAKRWIEMADGGDHTRLAFDRPGTWSLKYNLVWDRLLHLDLFPPEIARREVAYYLTKLAPYGLPLDSRNHYTKLDWEIWAAALSDSRADFEALTAPIANFLNETPQRVPLTDWYWTHDGRQVAMQARSVVGGVFIQLLVQEWRA